MTMTTNKESVGSFSTSLTKYNKGLRYFFLDGGGSNRWSQEKENDRVSLN